MSIVGVDTDGILRNIVNTCIETYERIYHEKSSVTHDTFHHWAIKDNLPKVENDYKFFMDNAYYIFECASKYKGADKLLKDLKKQGHHVAIVTHQFKGLENYTLNWFKRVGLDYDSIHFAKDKSTVKMQYLIDDGLHNLYRVERHGVKPICVAQPWNTKYKGKRLNLEDVISEIR